MISEVTIYENMKISTDRELEVLISLCPGRILRAKNENEALKYRHMAKMASEILNERKW
jgi:hypothetical protein